MSEPEKKPLHNWKYCYNCGDPTARLGYKFCSEFCESKYKTKLKTKFG